MSLKYTKEHEWIELLADGTALVGISNHAQESLGDVTFVEMPQIGDEFAAGETFAVVESVKAASDIYMPVAGTVVEINPAIESDPQLVNASATSDGWLVKISPKNPDDINALMTERELFGFAVAFFFR